MLFGETFRDHVINKIVAASVSGDSENNPCRRKDLMSAVSHEQKEVLRKPKEELREGDLIQNRPEKREVLVLFPYAPQQSVAW